MRFIGILWNTVSDYANEIFEDIDTIGNVLVAYEVDLENEYESFVRDIYERDGIAKWKIDQKINSMLTTASHKIVIIVIEIPDMEIKFNALKKKDVIVQIENLKKLIREKYATLVNNYFFDIVFHMTDNEEELTAILEVLNTWFPHININDNMINDFKRVRKKDKNENK